MQIKTKIMIARWVNWIENNIIFKQLCNLFKTDEIKIALNPAAPGQQTTISVFICHFLT